MYLDKNKIINELKEKDIIKICMELGSDYPRLDSQGNLIFQTICHGGSSWKLYYYTETGLFHCYTKCGQSMDIIHLVINAHKSKGINLSWYNALRYIAKSSGKLFTSQKINTDNVDIIEDWTWINGLTKKRDKAIPELKEYSEQILELFNYNPVSIWLSDGVSESVLSEFEIGYYSLQNCITIPVRDINGRLIGVRARYLLEDDIEKGKYRPMVISGDPLKFNTGCTLYGLYQNQNAIRTNKKVFLFEGEKSVQINHTFYGDKDLSLCVFGSNITDTQVRILLMLGVTHLVVCFDKEYKDSATYEAEIYYNKLLEKLVPLLKYFTIELVMDRQNLLEEKDAPVDKGFEVWNKLLDDKIMVTYEDLQKAKGEDENNN